jgi:DNA mismatch repair protein MutL
MARIQRLPEALANQIAAGEVVERPASVVKELVENAIDAGATRIDVVIDLGGKRLIRVEDDGEGMTRDDAVLAFERHATSKIRAAADLGAIRTLGFRGEALPSIASVSRLTLRSRTRAQQTGTEVSIAGGTRESVREVGAPVGTAIEVRDLFHNLPARRKFLKSDAAEATQVSRLMTQLALGYPEIGFSLTSAGRPLLRVPATRTLRERFYQVIGERPGLLEIQKQAAGIAVVGFAAALAERGPTRGPQHVFVNRRAVKDRTIAHAISQAYSVATIKERSPEVHLFIEMPADRVDVNVHPAKAEVRFLEQSVVHEVVRRALADALGQPAVPELRLTGPLAGGDAAWGPGLPGLGSVAQPTGIAARDLAGGLEGSAAEAVVSGALASAAAAPAPVETALEALRPLVPVGQFRHTFIIAVDADGISIVDQHVAHERVLFEQVIERLAAGRLESQRLLVPLVVELSPGEVAALLGQSAALGRLGFEVESFGGNTVRIGAVPALLSRDAAEATVRALANDLEGLGGADGADAALRRMAATTACHGAVKANDPLSLDRMQYILDELRRTSYSTVCPHGRPVVLRLTRQEIERNFQRI